MKTHSYPNPWDLAYFQELASTENLSRAAERLNVSQPALSLSLKRLEDQLQTTLFIRRHRGLSLTPAGRHLLKECNHLLAAWSAVVSEARKSQEEVRGRYTLGCHPSVGIYSLSPLLREIYEDHAEIEIHLRHDLSRVICEQVISGAIDFGIVVNPVAHPDLVLHKLAKDEVCFWHKAGTLSDVVIYNPDLVQAQTLIKKSKGLRFRRSIFSESLEVIASLAAVGTGVAILPSRIVQKMAPELKRMPETPSFSDEIVFVYRADLPRTAGAKAVMGRLKKLKL
jgi:DNA-binding transcriptional LysR family regulator